MPRVTLGTSLLLTGLLWPGPAAAAGPTGRPRIWITAANLAQLRAVTGQTTPSLGGPVPAQVWASIGARATRLAAAPTYQYSVQIPAANNEHPGWKWSYTFGTTPPPPHPESPHYPPWTAMFQEREDSLTTRLKHFALVALVNDDQRCFEKAKEVALGLAAWPVWTDQSYNSGSLSACLDTGHCTEAVALFYDWCYAKLTAAERQTLREALVAKGIEPIRRQLTKLDPYHNFWAVVNTGFGLAAVALAGDEPLAAGWIDEAIVNTRRQFDRQGRDGGSFEGPMYGTYAADQLAGLILALDTAGVPHDLRQHPFLATLAQFCVNGASPHGLGQPTFGDGGWGAAYPRALALLANAGDEAARYALLETGLLGELGDLNRFLACAPLLARQDRPAVPAWRGSAAFVDVGYGFLRGETPDEPFLALKAGPPTEAVGHNHYDQLSFQITAPGGVVAADPGYRSYFNPPARRYTSGTLGHSTVVLDLDDEYLRSSAVSTPGRDQVNVEGGRLTSLLPSPGITSLTADGAAAYHKGAAQVLDRFTRQAVYLPPHAYLLLDDLAAPAAHRYSWLLHGPAGAAVRWDGAAAELRGTQTMLYAWLFAPGGVTWSGGDYPGAEQYGPYLAGSTSRTAATTFRAVLVPRRNNQLLANASFEQGLAGWQIRDADGQRPNHRIVTEAPASGQQCARIVGAGYLYSSRFSLPVGTRFSATCRYRTQGASKGATLTIYYWNASNAAFQNLSSPPLKSEGTWAEARLEGTVPVGCATICLAFNYFDTGQGDVDAVAVETALPLPTLQPPRLTARGEQAADGLLLEVDGWRHEVTFGPRGELATDGSLGIVSRNPEGQVANLLVQEGTWLRRGGEELLRLPTRGTLARRRVGEQWVESRPEDLGRRLPQAAR